MITRFGFKLLRRKSVCLSFSKNYQFSDSESDYNTSDNSTSTYDETNIDKTNNENVNGDAQQKDEGKISIRRELFYRAKLCICWLWNIWDIFTISIA